jgi:hypothetical protein
MQTGTRLGWISLDPALGGTKFDPYLRDLLAGVFQSASDHLVDLVRLVNAEGSVYLRCKINGNE